MAVAGAPRAFTLLHNASRWSGGGDFFHLAILEHQQDVAVDDVLAHRQGAVGHAGIGQLACRHAAKILAAVSRRLARCFSLKTR